ncbi:MAG: TRAM domain-containing protein [Planctomycetes bacterium]|nr:TRAM domain-containing protein [Planctomycetota bacterium]
MVDQPTSADEHASAALPAAPPSIELPSLIPPRQRSSEKVMLRAIRLLFMVLLAVVTLLPFVGPVTDFPGSSGNQQQFSFLEFAGLLIAVFVFGVLVMMIDWLTPNKKLGAVFGVYLGIVAGLVGALAVGALIDLVAASWDLTGPKQEAYIGLIKLAVGISLCYLAVSIVLTTKDDFRLVIPYVEFAKQVRGVRPLLLDTSALIDGRIEGLGQTGFIASPLVVPQFVLDELQTLSDSSDKLKRAKGRRGLTMIGTLQANPYLDVSIDPTEVPGGSVDHMLLELAGQQNMRILTTDYNLDKVAKIRDVAVLNINELANALKPQVIPGQSFSVEIVKRGEAAGQGVGYLPDGTMVVVEDAAERVGDQVAVDVTNSLQTSAGRMIFGRIAGAAESSAHVQRMAQAATHQPRTSARPKPR